jgi:hypothetical protein
VRDETCVYSITPEPDEEGLELIRNSQWWEFFFYLKGAVYNERWRNRYRISN